MDWLVYDNGRGVIGGSRSFFVGCKCGECVAYCLPRKRIRELEALIDSLKRSAYNKH